MNGFDHFAGWTGMVMFGGGAPSAPVIPPAPPAAAPPTMANTKVAQSAASQRASAAAAAGAGLDGTVLNQGGPSGLVPDSGTPGAGVTGQRTLLG